jgi:outer membrane protein with beta-barrel domain
MRKISCIVILIFACSAFIQAQVFRFGIDPGIALSKGMYTNFSGDRRIYAGFDGGGLVQMGKKKLKFQAEVNYSQVGVELNNGNMEWTIKHSYITIPLLAKYNLDKINLLTGPQMGFRLESKTDTSGAGSTDVKDQFKSSDFDWVFGGEIKITKNVFLGIRYVLGITNISERLNFEMKNRYTSFRLGYLF